MIPSIIFFNDVCIHICKICIHVLVAPLTSCSEVLLSFEPYAFPLSMKKVTGILWKVNTFAAYFRKCGNIKVGYCCQFGVSV